MVGIPRSRGCQLCVKRRVKCDEAQPGCGNCLRYKAVCPGYNKAAKFITEKHKVRSRSKGTDREGRDGQRGAADAHELPLSTRSTASAPRYTHPTPNRGLCIGNLVDSVRSKIAEPVICLLSWIDLERLGRVAVLDAAIYSVGLYLVGVDMGDQNAIDLSWSAYGTALRALQRSLQHSTEWKASETLAASILLCLFELFATSISSGTWLKHARGIGTLVQQRGAAAHAGGWDALMVVTFRGFLIMSDAFSPSGDACFLSRPEWQPVIRDAGNHILPDAPPAITDMLDDFFELLAEMPEILRWTICLRDGARFGSIRGLQSEAVLIERVVDYRRRLLEWHDRVADLGFSPEEFYPQNPSSPYATVFRHKTPGTGSMLMGYWASMIVVDEALALCQPARSESHKDELVQNILRSVECVGEGPVGLYRMSFAIEIAYEFARPEDRHWIERAVPRIQRHAVDTLQN